MPRPKKIITETNGNGNHDAPKRRGRPPRTDTLKAENAELRLEVSKWKVRAQAYRNAFLELSEAD